MSLKIKGWRKITKIAVGATLGLLLLIFFIRVVTFEDAYYREKEGSERAEVAKTEETIVIEEPAELVEEEPTEYEVREYYVAPERPRYLTIEPLGIYNSRIRPVSINSNGELGTPNNIFDVGWYESSSLPGGGRTLLIDGHNGGPHVRGVFKNLPDLGIGEIIWIERGDGLLFKYIVTENVTKSLDEANLYMVEAMKSPEPGKESVTLISCTGEWSSQRNTYLSRQFVRAVLEGSFVNE